MKILKLVKKTTGAAGCDECGGNPCWCDEDLGSFGFIKRSK